MHPVTQSSCGGEQRPGLRARASAGPPPHAPRRRSFHPQPGGKRRSPTQWWSHPPRPPRSACSASKPSSTTTQNTHTACHTLDMGGRPRDAQQRAPVQARGRGERASDELGDPSWKRAGHAGSATRTGSAWAHGATTGQTTHPHAEREQQRTARTSQGRQHEGIRGAARGEAAPTPPTHHLGERTLHPEKGGARPRDVHGEASTKTTGPTGTPPARPCKETQQAGERCAGWCWQRGRRGAGRHPGAR
jgi:hypothetical protein